MTALADLRKKAGYTQEEMSKLLNIGLSTYNQYENSQRHIPRDVANKIAAILNVSIEDIFLPTRFTVQNFTNKD